MATSKPVSENPVRNDGGTIVKGNGKDSDSPITNSLAVSDVAVGNDGNGSNVLENDHSVKALTGGVFAYTPAKGTEFLICMAGPNADTVNGSASTILSVGGRYDVDGYDGICELNSTRDSSGNLVAFGNDNAAGPAMPSRSVPGELTYMFGGKAPATVAYKAKNVAE
jgi:hypothetical protein